MLDKITVKGAKGGTLEFSKAAISKGKNAGEEYFKPTKFDDLRKEDIEAVIDGDDLFEECVLPFIAKTSLAATREAMKQSNGDENKFQEIFAKLFLSLSATGEPTRGLKKQIQELMQQMGVLVTQLPDKQTEFMEVAKKVGELQKKYDDAKAAKEASSDNAEPAPAVAA